LYKGLEVMRQARVTAPVEIIEKSMLKRQPMRWHRNTEAHDAASSSNLRRSNNQGCCTSVNGRLLVQLPK
jgi:hypothetical protein